MIGVLWTAKYGYNDSMIQKKLISPHHFGCVLADTRRKLGVTQRQLSIRTGLSERYISMLENGDREPRLSMVLRLAAALGIRAQDLVAEYEGRMTDFLLQQNDP